jgi:four helix bundle protein
MELSRFVFKMTAKFPKSEVYGLVSQMRRSSIGIPSNIAEGYGRRSNKEFKQFLAIAYGSALELETQLILSKDFKYVSGADYAKTSSLLQEVLKMLNSIIAKLKQKV